MLEQEALDYLERSNRYWRQAQEFLEKGEPAKAAEMSWGSVVARAEALAVHRTRSALGNHRGIRRFIRDIAREEGPEELYYLFSLAESLHVDFYREFLEAEDVRLHLVSLGRFSEQIDRLIYGS